MRLAAGEVAEVAGVVVGDQGAAPAVGGLVGSTPMRSAYAAAAGESTGAVGLGAAQSARSASMAAQPLERGVVHGGDERVVGVVAHGVLEGGVDEAVAAQVVDVGLLVQASRRAARP